MIVRPIMPSSGFHVAPYSYVIENKRPYTYFPKKRKTPTLQSSNIPINVL